MKSNRAPKSNVTPGPWSVAPNGCCVFTDALAEGRGVAMCGMNARTPEEIAANAKLIAAAPTLLAALNGAVKFFNGGLDSAGFDPTDREERDEYAKIAAQINIMRDAIAAAS